MTPTVESIKAAIRSAAYIRSDGDYAILLCSTAEAFFVAGSPVKCVADLKRARKRLITLRRTQTAALTRIDQAIASAKGGTS